MFRITLFLAFVMFFPAAVLSQNSSEKKMSTSTVSETPVNGVIQFQLVRTNGSEIFLVKDVPEPNANQKVVTEEVKVPYTIIVEKDGKPETVVKTRTEERKRMVTPTIRKLVVAANNYKFKTLDRKPISKADLIGKLGMGSGKMVVQVFPKQKIPNSIKLQLDKGTIIMEYEPRNR